MQSFETLVPEEDGEKKNQIGISINRISDLA